MIWWWCDIISLIFDTTWSSLFFNFSGTSANNFNLYFSEIKNFQKSRLISGVTLSKYNLSKSILDVENDEKYHYQKRSSKNNFFNNQT